MQNTQGIASLLCHMAVTLEHFVAGKKVEDVSDPGIWELMYFGHVQ